MIGWLPWNGKTKVGWTAVVVVLVAAILATGVWLAQRLYDQAREAAIENLRAVSALKTRELTTWVSDNSRALTFPAGSTPALLADRWLARGDRQAAEGLRWLMASIMTLSPDHLAIWLYDPAGQRRLSSVGDNEHVGGVLPAMLEQARSERRAVVGDLHMDKVGDKQRLTLDVATPLFVEEHRVQRLVGYLVYQIDPALQFFSILSSWPVPSASAETLLFKINGSEVVFLSPLRHRPDIAPATLRLDASRHRGLLASQAVFDGRNIGEGRDYAGRSVVGVVSRVPETEWYLVAKIDRTEVFESARRDALAVAATTLILLAALAVVIVYGRRAEHAHHQAALAEEALARREAEERSEFFVRYAKDIVLLLDFDTDLIVDANEAAVQAYGYTRDELLRLTGSALQHDLLRSVFADEVRHADGAIFETLHRRKDGSCFPVEINARALKYKGRFYRQGIVRDITERKEAERRLRESEERYREIVESDVGEICRWLPDTTLTFVNRTYAAARGVPAEQLLGRRWIEFVPDGEREAVQAVVDDLAANPRRRYYEHSAMASDGSLRWGAWTDIPDFGDGGGIVEFQSIGLDITARKTAEAALTESETRFRVILDSIREAVFLIDMATLLILAPNRRALELFGGEGDGLAGVTFGDLGEGRTPNSPADAAEWVRKAGRGEVHTFEWYARHRTGRLFWSEATLRRIVVGSSTYVLAVVRDVTEQRNNLWALIESEDRFHAIVDSIGEAIFIHDLDTGAIIASNRAATTLYGYSESEFRECRVADLSDGVPPYSQGEAIVYIGAAACGVPQRFEWRARNRAGKLLWVEVSLRKARIGGCERIIAVVHDIDERKAQEEALQRHLDEQRQLVRKLEEAQNQLLQSEKMSAIGQLAAGVAHEINNPVGFVSSNLGSLKGYLDDIFDIVDAYEAAEREGVPALERARALRESRDFAFVRKDIGQLLDESRDGLDRVRKIVLDLKDFSRVGEAEWQWADLRQGIDSTLNIVWHELKYHCTVKKDYGELPQVWCLPSQLNQVFMNLLVNASHAIEGRGEIAISCGRDGDDAVFVAIADTGKGIAKENLNRIFEPFFTTKPAGKGTGLGLSLVYGIVQRHRGRIEVDSAVGVGTTFRIVLPIRSDSERDEGGEQ